MSPEQASGQAVDGRSDQFALGVVMWELLTGKRLFKGESDMMTLRLVKDCQVPPPSQLNPKLPPGLDEVVLRALVAHAGQALPGLRRASGSRWRTTSSSCACRPAPRTCPRTCASCTRTASPRSRTRSKLDQLAEDADLDSKDKSNPSRSRLRSRSRQRGHALTPSLPSHGLALDRARGSAVDALVGARAAARRPREARRRWARTRLPSAASRWCPWRWAARCARHRRGGRRRLPAPEPPEPPTRRSPGGGGGARARAAR